MVGGGASVLTAPPTHHAVAWFPLPREGVSDDCSVFRPHPANRHAMEALAVCSWGACAIGSGIRSAGQQELARTMKPSIARFREFFADLARARRAHDTYMRLDALSDAALAARGLRRADLIREAFKDF